METIVFALKNFCCGLPCDCAWQAAITPQQTKIYTKKDLLFI